MLCTPCVRYLCLQYEDNEVVKVWVNKVGPYNNPQQASHVSVPAPLGGLHTKSLELSVLVATVPEGFVRASRKGQVVVTIWFHDVAPSCVLQTFNFYKLPFCRPRPNKRLEHSWGGLGEVRWLTMHVLGGRRAYLC